MDADDSVDTRERIRQLWFADERACVQALLPAAALDATQRERIDEQARRLIGAIRATHRGGAEQLLARVPLNSVGGLALLSLAESLLRVPDVATADLLLRERLGAVRWRERLPPSSWRALLQLASVLVGDAASAGALQRLGTPLVRAGVRASLRWLGGQFVFSDDIEHALRRARRQPQYRYSFDMLGEAAVSAEDAERYFGAYEHALHAVGGAYRGRGVQLAGGVSVKLSALHPRYQYTQAGRIRQQLWPRLRQLASVARQYDIALTIDAEESERLEPSLELIEALMSDDALGDWGGLGVAVQAYQKRAPAVVEHLLQLSAHRRPRLLVRLVKGAYWDSEIKWAQMDGLEDYPVYTRKAYTDVAYLACARRLLAARDRVLPQFATHNALTVASVLELARESGSGPFEFQCLYGMGSVLFRQLRSSAVPVRIYAPVGTRATLLAYLMRRLMENGAAASFVHRAAAERVPVRALLEDPQQQAQRWQGAPHPSIARPPELFGPERRNSRGVALADPRQRAPLLQAIAALRAAPSRVTPLLAFEGPVTGASPRQLDNPARLVETVSRVSDMLVEQIAPAVAQAQAGARGWAETEIALRASVLERAAALFEQQLPSLVALAVLEAGKSLANGVGEVREAVDYLRYYAAQIRGGFDQAAHRPLGVVVCISPWNFPLAIFTGQVAAALASGNAVLAKPAEQTCAMAAAAVQLLHQAGVPRAVLQLLPGDGEHVGAALVAAAGIDGVVFTGSGAAARAIARTLAPRGDVPLIAETGGQNALIVDSTALPEQVVVDVLRSAFDSAGQRCSALRLLCLQRDVTPALLRMIIGGMRELRVGDPADLATDVGPLIDQEARERIERYLQQHRARIVFQTPLSDECAGGVFVAPTLLEIGGVNELAEEVFGPVLHVLQFDPADLTRLIDDLNATGYALTFGIASRIAQRSQLLADRTAAGNVYVNRNIIGAVVGVQPFGGQGLSGTGPKAGGPLYLHRLLSVTPGPLWQQQQGQRTPRQLHQLLDWLQGAGGTLDAAELPPTLRAALIQQCRHYAATTPLHVSLPLQGYVGESNQLRLRARGALRASGQSLASVLAQLAAALASGNCLSIEQPALRQRLLALLPAPLRAQIAQPGRRCAAVLVDGAEARLQPVWLRQLCEAVAAQEGAIIGVVIADPPYPLERLLAEQTITVNTAAVGGDARLLALDDG